MRVLEWKDEKRQLTTIVKRIQNDAQDDVMRDTRLSRVTFMKLQTVLSDDAFEAGKHDTKPTLWTAWIRVVALKRHCQLDCRNYLELHACWDVPHSDTGLSLLWPPEPGMHCRPASDLNCWSAFSGVNWRLTCSMSHFQNSLTKLITVILMWRFTHFYRIYTVFIFLYSDPAATFARVPL